MFNGIDELMIQSFGDLLLSVPLLRVGPPSRQKLAICVPIAPFAMLSGPQQSCLAANIILPVLATVAVISRLIVQGRSRSDYGVSEYLIILALVCYTHWRNNSKLKI